MYERTSKNPHLETVWYEMDMLEFSYQEFMKKPRQYTKVFVENKAPPSTAEACSIQRRERVPAPISVIAMRSGRLSRSRLRSGWPIDIRFIEGT